jgi:hypothetical protein
MTLVERMDIFSLLYGERLKPSAVAAALNRGPSSITRELERGMDKGSYNPVIAEVIHLEARRNQRPHLKITVVGERCYLPNNSLKEPKGNSQSDNDFMHTMIFGKTYAFSH